ncbi:MAG: RluA family pseudouridine synthase [Clostridia bacterium]|nr:RluA family pseudouridine synthase [Clostridia bacterium]
MMRVEKFVPDENFRRVDSYLSSMLVDVTRSAIKKIADEGGVEINGKKVRASEEVRAGDEVTITIPDPVAAEAKPENIPIDIIYEDDDFAVINKPQGMVVHAGAGNTEGTLVNALLYNLDSLSGINGVIRPGIVHRIDKDTSGLLIVAKNDKAHIELSRQISEKSCKRTYLALLDGNLKEESGKVETYIGRSDGDRKKMAVVPEGKGRYAETDWEVVERFGDYTLCRFSLRTGRTHQIRVHAKYLGHPVVGDRVYGQKNCRFNLDGQLLHAYRLEFTHPSTGERMSFEVPLPEYFENVLCVLRARNVNS